ncbi:MAG: glycosyltransferase [Candidatus Pelagadaptatus aseana]|uniref:glycosyltransferase n=1 Tax=Candidatus Pelagadaptatus aseana TaxID=3120508 RepID=UPI0039B1655A
MINFFMPSFRGGGAERVFIDIANKLASRGEDVEILVLSEEGPYKDLLIENVGYKVIGRGGALKSFFFIFNFFWNCKSKTVFTCLTHLNLVSILCWLLSFKRCQLIVTEHNNFTNEKAALNFFKRGLILFGAKVLYRSATKVIAVSKGVAKDLSSVLGLDLKNIEIIYNPVDTTSIQKMAEASTLDDFDSPTIIGVGRLVVQKRFDLLIHSFSDVVKGIPSAKLLILGDGGERNTLENLVNQLNLSSNVRFLGFVDNPFQYITRADVLVLSSDFEGFGNVIVEALSLGTPVISTDCPSGPSEILNSDNIGILVPVDDEVALARSISNVLRNSNFDSRLLQERAEYFNVDNVADQYQRIIGSFSN